MVFQDPIASLTKEETKLTYQQLREMLRMARVTIEDCASILGITGRTIYHYVDEPRRVVPEDYLIQIIKILRGVERYKRFFHETKLIRIGEYLCAWQAYEGSRITFDDHEVYGIYGVQDRFEELVKSKEFKHHVLKVDGHVRLAFRLLRNEMLAVEKKIMQLPVSVVEQPIEGVVESRNEQEIALHLKEEHEELEHEENLTEGNLV
jgi:hypothetical protein